MLSLRYRWSYMLLIVAMQVSAGEPPLRFADASSPAANDNAMATDAARLYFPSLSCQTALASPDISKPSLFQYLRSLLSNSSTPNFTYTYTDSIQFSEALKKTHPENRIASLQKSMHSIPTISIQDACRMIAVFSPEHQNYAYELLKNKITTSLRGNTGTSVSEALAALSPEVALKVLQDATKFMNALPIEDIASIDDQIDPDTSENKRSDYRTRIFIETRWTNDDRGLTIADIDLIMGFQPTGPLANFLKTAVISQLDPAAFNMLLFSLSRHSARNPYVAPKLLNYYYVKKASLIKDEDIPQALETLSNYTVERQEFLEFFFRARARKTSVSQIIAWADKLQEQFAHLNKRDPRWADAIKLKNATNDLVASYLKRRLPAVTLEEFKTLVKFMTDYITAEKLTVNFIDIPGKVTLYEVSDLFFFLRNTDVRNNAIRQFLDRHLQNQNIFRTLSYASLFDSKPYKEAFIEDTITARANQLLTNQMQSLLSGQYAKHVTEAAIIHFITSRSTILTIADAAQILAFLSDSKVRRAQTLKFLEDNKVRFQFSDKTDLITLL